VETNEARQQQGVERLTIAVEGAPDSDLEEHAQLTTQLRQRLLELEVERVDLVRGGEVPPGSKVADPITIGAIAVTLAPAAIQAVIGLLQSWLKDRPVRSVKVTLGRDSLELSNASPEQLEQLTRAFVARHPTS
jgi:hypothetical protein